MTGWIQGELRIAKRKWDPKFELVLDPVSRKSGGHQFGRNRGQDDFPVIPDMITVRVGDESRPLLIPWIEPKI
jgi:hypothetical protein